MRRPSKDLQFSATHVLRGLQVPRFIRGPGGPGAGGSPSPLNPHGSHDTHQQSPATAGRRGGVRASILVNRYGHLYLAYEVEGRRCHEYTDLPDTVENRTALAERLAQVSPPGLLPVTVATAAPPPPLAAGRTPAAPATEFAQTARTWYAENKVSWKPSVAVEFQGTLEKHLIPRFQGREAATITASEIKQFRTALVDLPGRQGRKLSPKRINNILVVLRLVLTDACTQAGIPNPFATIKRLKVPKADIRPFTLEELSTFLAGVRRDYADYYLVRFFTGMRPGEVDGLQWDDVDWRNRKLSVRRTRQRTGANAPKTEDSTRDIDLLPPAFEAFRRQQVVTGSRSPYVFCTKNGTPRDHNLITRRVWYPALDRLGIARRSPYQSRHTFATLMLATGENPEWIARQLGHTDTTLLFTVYSRFVPNLTRLDGSAVMRVLEEQGVLTGQPQASLPGTRAVPRPAKEA